MCLGEHQSMLISRMQLQEGQVDSHRRRTSERRRPSPGGSSAATNWPPVVAWRRSGMPAHCPAQQRLPASLRAVR